MITKITTTTIIIIMIIKVTIMKIKIYLQIFIHIYNSIYLQLYLHLYFYFFKTIHIHQYQYLFLALVSITTNSITLHLNRNINEGNANIEFFYWMLFHIRLAKLLLPKVSGKRLVDDIIKTAFKRNTITSHIIIIVTIIINSVQMGIEVIKSLLLKLNTQYMTWSSNQKAI